jgi:hypothetical protein
MATTAMTVTDETPPTLKALDFDYLPPPDPKAVEQAMLIGDLSKMTDEQRIAYYVATCRSLNLNPLTKPFQALTDDDGTLKLYPDKGLAEQLRKRDKVSTKVLGREILDGLYIVTVVARTPDGREEEAQGIVPLVKAKGTWEDWTDRDGKKRRRFKPTVGADGQEVMLQLSPTERANAMKRAETQGKRRATLAICGLGFPDYEAEPTSAAHPQALALRTLSPEEAAKDVSQHIEDLYGPPPADEHLLGIVAEVEAAIAHLGGDMAQWEAWAEGTVGRPRRDFTVDDYQRWLDAVRVVQQRGPRQKDAPEHPEKDTRKGRQGTNAPPVDAKVERDPETGEAIPPTAGQNEFWVDGEAVG